MLMPTLNQNYLIMTGHHQTFLKLVKNTWNDCVARRITFLGFGILEIKKNGGYPFIVIRVENMSYQFFHLVIFLAQLKLLLKQQLNFTYNCKKT